MFSFCGIKSELFQTVCSSIDKLDKKKWKQIVPELVSKGLGQDTIDKLETCLKGKSIDPLDLGEVSYIPSKWSQYMKQVYSYLKLLSPKSFEKVKMELTLARGLDYYIGIIFEVNLVGKKFNKIGSVCGGGRYDDLCGIPCVGFSVGIDRLLSVMNPVSKSLYNPSVWVIQINSDNPETNMAVYQYRMKIVKRLRYSEINTGTELRIDTGLGKQIKYVLKNQIPYIIFVGTEEMKQNRVTIKDIRAEIQDNLIEIDNAIRWIKNIW
jgi:histidyl-tRNA synthetase